MEEDAQFESAVEEEQAVEDYGWSRYDLWTNSPSSIHQRRRRLSEVLEGDEYPLPSCRSELARSVDGDVESDDARSELVSGNAGRIWANEYERSSGEKFEDRLGGSGNGDKASGEEHKLQQHRKKWWLRRLKNSSSSKLEFRPHKVKVRMHKKACKEFRCLVMLQDIAAHRGAIWSLRFSLDGRLLASGGEDCAVRVWKVEPDTEVDVDSFSLVQEAACTFLGHTESILDLSWSRSKLLLSSSMDKTVRLWHVSQEECLQVFAHHDCVTSIQFNPADDKFFVSGSLDRKLRIWSIAEHEVVAWSDAREMITAVCYTPDAKGIVAGSHKGTCRFYTLVGGDKLQLEAHVDILNSRGRRSRRKITALQCMQGNPIRLLVTSADSCVRLYHGAELICKYTGFRNTKAHSGATFSACEDFIVSASSDWHVYIWNTEQSGQSYEDFYSHRVTVALPWPANLHRPHAPYEEHVQDCTHPKQGVVIVTCSAHGQISVYQNRKQNQE